MNDFIHALEKEFLDNSDAVIAVGQANYMRNKFEFFGIKAPEHREIMRPFLHKNYLPNKKVLAAIVKTLWQKPQREFQYFGQELFFKYHKEFEIDDIVSIEYMITHKSWWDSVDYIATKIAAAYFKKFPGQLKIVIPKWMASGNIWLQRSAILFQLKYKDDLNTQLLTDIIDKLTGSDEFFINKAIGWILREYSKINADWVMDFVAQRNLSPLSKREALRLVI